MKNLLLILLTMAVCSNVCKCQDEPFYLELSKDTILAGNVLQLTFVANNIAGKFEAPDLKGLAILSGPNTSTSMSMVNGEISQYASYSYTILLEDIGEIFIPPAFFVTNDGTFETEPASIIVLPNPEGIIEQSPAQSGMYQFRFPNVPDQTNKYQKKKTPKKKKRKLKKI